MTLRCRPGFLFLLSCFLIMHTPKTGAQLYEGDTCTMRWGGSTGVCRPLSGCPTAQRLLQYSGVRPTVCGFASGTESIVCCADSATPAPNKNPTAGNPSSGNDNNRIGNSKQRISEIKCEEYSSRVQYTVEAVPLVLNPEPLNFKVPKCDYSSTPLIVGGEEAEPGEFPHMAVIGWPGKDANEYLWLCGGSLISENFVLTAAHCCYHRDYDTPTMIRLGEHNLKSASDGARPQDIAIAQIIRHPNYNISSNYDDIALMRLARSAILEKFVRPACLYEKDTYTDQPTIATGWGRINSAEEASDTLLKVSIKVIDRETCKSFFTGNTRKLRRGIIDKQLCAGDLEGGHDTCQGDSGGPLQTADKANRCIFYILGVTSFGRGCGARNSPGVYTNVASYLDWIENTVWPSRN